MLAVAALAGCNSAPPAGPSLKVSAQAAQAAVPRFGLFELSLKGTAPLSNPLTAASLAATFSAPDGTSTTVPGFYYGSGRWMVRFRPHTPGPWKYTWNFAPAGGTPSRGSGSFECTLPANGHGRLRISSQNRYRWVFEDGTPYFPLGLQEGVSPRLPDFEIDGERREDKPRRVPMDDYFRIYGEAGFNLFRFSQRNNTYPLFESLDEPLEVESRFTDRLLASAYAHGFRTLFGFFGYYDHWIDNPSRWQRGLILLTRTLWPREGLDRPANSEAIEAERRFIRYSVARWGVWVDFWELLNERRAAPEWIALMASYTHSIDPDRKPVTTSWEAPSIASIGINAPHWYESESELASDRRVAEQAASWKAYGKPVLVGEQGNSGMNWEPGSAVRMRVRLWTSLFQEIGLIFWNTSWSKSGMHLGRFSPGQASNIYLGPEERSYVQPLAAFSSRLDSAAQMTPVSVSHPGVRAYGLLSPDVAAVYLHHYATHAAPASGVSIALNLPTGGGPFRAQWLDPATGKTLNCTAATPGHNTFPAPAFQVDAALLVTRAANCTP